MFLTLPKRFTASRAWCSGTALRDNCVIQHHVVTPMPIGAQRVVGTLSKGLR
jgi:hypothetical protein